MRSRVRLLALFAAGAIGSAGSLVAQAAGLPVRNAGIGTGFGIAADLGFPNSDAGKGTAYGATGIVGLGPLGISATLARWTPKGLEAITSAGATLNLKIIGGPLIPLSLTLQGGVGYHRESTIEGGKLTSLHLPAGIGLALTIPNPAFSIKPWVAPRVDVSVQRETGGISGGDTQHDEHFGISGGVDLGFLNGLTLRAMYDRVQASNGVHPSIISVGLGFRVGK